MMKLILLRLLILSGFFGLLLGCGPVQDKHKNSAQCTQYVSATVCQEIGQLLIVGFGGMDQDDRGRMTWNDQNGTKFSKNSRIAKDIADWHVGGVIYFHQILRKNNGKLIRDRNMVNGPQLTQLSHDLQAFNSQTREKQHLPPLPLIITVDQEGGTVNPLVFIATLPNYVAQALGKNQEISKNDPAKLQAALAFTNGYGTIMGSTLRSLGINLNFAPDVDVNINPLNHIIGGLGRSYSDDPQIVSDQAAQIIKGMHSQGVSATLKHFPGHGSSTGDTHKELVNVTDTYQMDKELASFQTLINRGFDDFIMSTHVINGQIDRSQCLPGDANNPATWCPGTMSYKTLTELLRQKLHFKGVIVSDDMTMDAIAKKYPLEEAIEKALNAGVNMFIVANHERDATGEFVITIAKLIHDGKVPQSRIDEAYRYVVKAKQHLFK